MLELLETVDSAGHLFALSNVLECGGKKNEILSHWLFLHRDRFQLTDLIMDYSNSNYHRNSRAELTREVLITNYKVGG